MKAYPETHWQGTVFLENMHYLSECATDGAIANADLGLMIAEDGRVWVCVNGVALLRFSPHRDSKMSKNATS